MMKEFLFFIVFVIFIMPTEICAQGGTWVWMHGSDTSGAPGNYGVLGLPADSNIPHPRYQSAYWKDKQGNFWMFGGVSWQSANPNVEQNDLWKYNPNTNQWTWINGPKLMTDVNGEFGIKGIPSVNNYPSARGWGVNCWTDTAGMLWLYGGYGADSVGNHGDLGDLWKYNIATNEWTWMKGRATAWQLSKYGSKDVYADSVTPGSIQEVKSSWVDKNNSFYIFGGKHNNSFSYGFETSNSMWQYNQSINQWRWRKGNNAFATSGNYGTKGIEDTANYPPGRASYTKWSDAFGNFYIFGGGRFRNATNAAPQPNMLNDTWKYNPTTNAWTWVSGANMPNIYVPYGPFCLEDTISYPAPRIENQTAQNDVCVNAFWNFGGYNMTKQVSYNDLWLFNSNNNNWIRVHGTDTAGYKGNPGIKGVANATNEIGGRCGVDIWVGNNNNDLWVFGGINYNTSDVNNDMWRFIPDSNCFRYKFNLPLIPPTDTALCAGENAYIYNLDTNWLIQVTPNIGVTFNTDSTQITFLPNSTTTYSLIAVDERLVGCVLPDTLQFTIIVDTLAIPITTINNFTTCAVDTNLILLDTNYQYNWWQNNGIITNADTSILKINAINNTYYNVITSYKNKCSTKDTITFTATVILPILPILSVNDTTICIADSVAIAIDNNYQIAILPNITTFTNADTTLVVLKPIANTTYTIIAKNTASICPAIDTFVFTIYVTPPIPIPLGPFDNQAICNGQKISLTLPENHTFSVLPISNFTITNNIGTASPTVNTVYTITINANNACEAQNTATWQVNINTVPIAAFTINPNIIAKPDDAIQLQNQSINATTYQWYLNDNVLISTQKEFTYKLFDIGKYCFTLVASNQYCKDTTENCINYIDDTSSMIYVPNVFSPNGDLLNDVLKISSRNISLVQFNVFNRWGNQVFEAQNINQGWDGFFKGKKCDVATYFYYIKYKTKNGVEKVLQGDVSLVQ